MLYLNYTIVDRIFFRQKKIKLNPSLFRNFCDLKICCWVPYCRVVVKENENKRIIISSPWMDKRIVYCLNNRSIVVLPITSIQLKVNRQVLSNNELLYSNRHQFLSLLGSFWIFLGDKSNFFCLETLRYFHNVCFTYYYGSIWLLIKCTSHQINFLSNVPFIKCTSHQMYFSSNELLIKCTSHQMYFSSNVLLIK